MECWIKQAKLHYSKIQQSSNPMIQQSTNPFNDAKLPHLGMVTNSAAMQPILAENFRGALEKLNAHIENCAIERIQYRRNRRCRLLYRLNLKDGSGKKFDQWFFGKLLREGQAQRQYEEALAAGNLQNGVWQPVALLPEFEMVIYTFPNDPDMPGLVKAADPSFAQAQIETNLSAFGLPEGWQCEQINFARVKYMPGKRCVLRYNARLQNRFGENREVSFYSKTYCDGMSRFHYQILQQAHARLSNAINIPRPLLHVGEANTLWQEPWEGRPLIDNLDQADWEELFPRLAAGVASFHRSQCEGLPPVDTLERAFDSAQEDAQMLGWLLPAQRLRFNNILLNFSAAKERLGELPGPLVPIHGAIRIEQFVARERELALVDFDAAALGDPLYDVAEFLTSLQYLEFTAGFSRESLVRAADLFRTSYQKQVLWKLAPSRLAYYAISALLSKMHDTMKNLDVNAMQKFDEILEILEKWSDGLLD